MIKSSTIATIALAAAAAAILPTLGLAQPGERPRPDRAGTIPCCTCVDGSTKSVSLSTGAVPWAVSGPGASGAAAVPVSLSAWSPLSGASWVGPSASASSSAAAGTYSYTVRFSVPRCVIGGRVMIKGRAGGDNRVTVKLDGVTLGSTPGSTEYGFQAGSFVTFSAPVTSAGGHTLTVEVTNKSGSSSPTGMAAQATVEVQCPREATLGASPSGSASGA